MSGAATPCRAEASRVLVAVSAAPHPLQHLDFFMLDCGCLVAQLDQVVNPALYVAWFFHPVRLAAGRERSP